MAGHELDVHGRMRRHLLLGIASATALAVSAPLRVFAQAAAPDIRRLDVVIPLSAGGGSDLLFRQLVEEVRPKLSASIAVVNVPGDGSLLGLSRVARAAPTDAMLGIHNPPNTVLSQLARGADAPVDIRTLTPIAGYGRTFTVVATAADSGINDYKGLVEAYKSGAQRLLGGTDRAGSSELTAELLKSDVGLPWAEYVAYDGSGAMNAALARNEVPAGLASYDAVLDGMKSGTLRPLLVLGSTQRAAGMPDTPTSAELGFKSLAEVAAPIRVIVGPPNMDPAMRDYFVGLWKGILTDAAVIEKFKGNGIALEYIAPEDVDAAINGAFASLESLPALKTLLSKK
jgi:tripartite-type tricarboxylate transporter receptor subunit TctC